MTHIDLGGVKGKIERAKHHIAHLKTRLHAVFQPAAYSFSFDLDSNTGHHIYKAFNVPALPEDLPLIVGDALHNLRSALDHLAWQLVIFDGKTPSGSTTFPLLYNPFRQDGSFREVQLVPAIGNAQILDQLELCQPYRGVTHGVLQDPSLSALYQLSQLNNIDKHRLLLTVACALDVRHMWWGMPGEGPAPRFGIYTGSLQEGAPVAWFDFGGYLPPSDFDPHPALHVALREVDVPQIAVIDVVDALEAYVFWVEDWVVNWRFGPLLNGASPLI